MYGKGRSFASCDHSRFCQVPLRQFVTPNGSPALLPNFLVYPCIAAGCSSRGQVDNLSHITEPTLLSSTNTRGDRPHGNARRPPPVQSPALSIPTAALSLQGAETPHLSCPKLPPTFLFHPMLSLLALPTWKPRRWSTETNDTGERPPSPLRVEH